MKRRTFVAASLAALASASIPARRATAAAAAGELPALGLDGKQLTLSASDVADLRAGLRGELITAGDGGYDTARRLWNAAFDRKPALIARCAGAADVRRAVSFATAHGLLTAVRGGGHSLSGQSVCDGGLVIDLSAMRGVRVDPVAREARVQPGTLLGPVDRESAAFALVTPLGTVADTGVAGLTLGGGQGRLSRKLGLTVDNLVEADLVTADGRWLRASAAENPDLHWALRGGGGNFGVVTSFTYRLHEMTPLMFGGLVTFPYADARRLLRDYADICASAPDELTTYLALTLDRERHARVIQLDVCCCASAADAERMAAPLRKLGKPLKDELGPAPYVKLQGSADPPGPADIGAYVKGGLVYGLTPSFIDATIDYVDAHPLDNYDIELGAVGGAVARVAPGDTAYYGRAASHALLAFSAWKLPGAGAEPGTERVRDAWRQLEPHTRGNYVNLANTDDRDTRVHAAYGENYERLAALKRRYDPTNLFRLNANIKPAA
jgi:FAD/FMN-containing dehydrogenase